MERLATCVCMDAFPVWITNTLPRFERLTSSVRRSGTRREITSAHDGLRDGGRFVALDDG